MLDFTLEPVLKDVILRLFPLRVGAAPEFAPRAKRSIAKSATETRLIDTSHLLLQCINVTTSGDHFQHFVKNLLPKYWQNVNCPG